MTDALIPLADILAAQRRIEGRVRRTPMMQAKALKTKLPVDCDVLLKLESLQATGSFKARGASNKLGTLSQEQIRKGIVTASGGNHGIAVAYAGWIAKVPATVFVPEGVSPLKAEKIKGYGATLVVGGKHFGEANGAALELAEREGLAYFHPYEDPAVMAGQGTLALEILDDCPAIDTLLIAIGGGGLISGMASAAKALKPSIRIVGVEPVGAATVHDSLAAGRVVTLPGIATKVLTLAAQRTGQRNFDIARETVEQIVLITDQDMMDAARALWLDLGIAADLSGAASMAALMSGKYRPRPGERVCVLVCGAGPDGVQ